MQSKLRNSLGHRGLPRENRQNCAIFCIFPVHGKNDLRWPQIGPGGFFPTNPDLANILGRTDLNFKNFYVFDFLDPKFPDFQVPRFPDAAADGRTLRSQPDPSPNAPRDQIRRKGPCCDNRAIAKGSLRNWKMLSAAGFVIGRVEVTLCATLS